MASKDRYTKELKSLNIEEFALRGDNRSRKLIIKIENHQKTSRVRNKSPLYQKSKSTLDNVNKK